MILIFILYALLALTFPLAQCALQYADPLFLITCRMFLAGACLLGYWILVVRRPVHIAAKDLGLFARASLFHMYVAFVPEFWALQYVSTLKTNLMYCATPFISALLEYMFFRKQLSRYNIMGIIVVCSGMIPLLFFPGSIALDTQRYPIIFLPEFMLMVAIISATYAWFLVRELLDRGYGIIFINGVSMIGGGLLSLTTLAIVHPPSGLIISTVPFLMTVMALVLLSNVIVYNLYGMLIKKYGFTFISLAGFLSPIFGALYAKLFFGDQLSWYHLVAFISICVGLKIFYSRADTK